MPNSQSETGTPKRSRTVLSPDSPPQPLKKLSMSNTDLILAEIKSVNGNIDKLRSDFAKEITTLTEKFDTALSGWELVKAQLVSKQSELENRLDRLERQEKRNSIVITGLNEIVDPGKVKSAVSDLFTNKLGVNVSINDAFQIKLRSGKTKVIAKLNSFEDKRSIMISKKSLSKDIFVDDDLISKDQFVRFQAREFVKGIRKEGMNIKIRTGMVIIDGVVHAWEEDSQTYVMRKN